MTALAACGGSDSSSEDPQKVIDNATLEGVESGNLDLSLHVKSEGKEGGNVDVSLSGPFQSGGKNLPQLAMTASAKGSAKGEDIDFEGGLTLLSDRAYVNYKGTEYEVDPTTFGFVKSGFEQAQQQGGSEANPADVTACQEAATGLKVGRLRRQPQQRRQRRRRRHQHDQGQRRPQRLRRDRLDRQADRKPGLQRPARSGGAAAGRPNSKRPRAKSPAP